jgi:site-specific recombinase XerD
MATHRTSSNDESLPGLRCSAAGHWLVRYVDDQTNITGAERLSPHTIATYQHKIQLFLDWWTDYHPEQPLTHELATIYRTWLEAEREERHRFSIRSYGLYLSGMRRWGAYLVTQQILPSNPFRSIQGPKRMNSHASGFLHRTQADQLLQSFDRTYLIEHRDYVICLLMLKTGARETELCQAVVGDQRTCKGQVELYLNSKGKKKEDHKREPVPLTPAIANDVQAYLNHRKRLGEPLTENSPLLATIREGRGAQNGHMQDHEMRRRIKLALQRAGLPHQRLTGLALRHTAAIQAFLDEIPFEEVQALMRHADKKTTKIFEQRAKGIRDRRTRRRTKKPRLPKLESMA